MVPAPLTPRSRFALALTLAALTGCVDEPSPLAPPDALAPHADVGTAAVTLAVTNTNDAGAGSLRQAIADAQSGDVIRFDAGLAGATIVLGAELVVGAKSITIEGPATGGITLHGGGAGRVLHLKSDLDGRPTLVLRNATVTGGRASPGGGIFVAGGTLTLEHSTVTGNQSDQTPSSVSLSGDGGGIAVHFGTLTLVNSTVSGNSTTYDGGGIGVPLVGSGHGGATITLVNSTVAFNEANSGGGLGLLVGDQSKGEQTILALRNSIVANNTAATSGTENCRVVSGAILLYQGTSLLNDDTCGAAGPAMLIADPLLQALASNGGPSRTHALPAASPAVDAATECNVATDQRYIVRPQGTACDIGAYEFTDFTRLSLTIAASGAVNPNTGVATVSGTLTCSAPASVELQVGLSQQQKTKRVPAVGQATDVMVVNCTSSKAWSIALTPPSGAFQTGTASATAATVNTPKVIAPASAAATVKLFWGKK